MIATRLSHLGTRHGAEKGTRDGATELLVTRHGESQAPRNTQYPLAHRHEGNEPIGQMRSGFGHAATPARGTEATALAGEGHEQVAVEARAVNPADTEARVAAADRSPRISSGPWPVCAREDVQSLCSVGGLDSIHASTSERGIGDSPPSTWIHNRMRSIPDPLIPGCVRRIHTHIKAPWSKTGAPILLGETVNAQHATSSVPDRSRHRYRLAARREFRPHRTALRRELQGLPSGE